ncbi:hypothetical protein FV242_33445 [Methylobacterium sp. WL64]|uniref:hypothetical protein n=1 Tax=Methylobacterium sp. WL64 TaxID=2603894 RepID=UPI0011C9DC99|nr:hypothetical protein [Methylobacterium sp. WL64]TXM96548.1 hypothetical protein FV242_33445 [Methylobacterium sp. WL64]
MTPANALSLVRRLAADEDRCEFYQPVLDELPRHSLDSDDLLEIIQSELGEVHCYRSAPTEKYHPATTSDYYSIWVEECRAHMFLKLLVGKASDGGDLLVITSFKKDTRT